MTLPPTLRLTIDRVLEESRDAIRVQETILASDVPITRALRGELADDLGRIAARLETLRRELLVTD